MGIFYPGIQEVFSAESGVSGLLAHILILAASIALSFYGLWGSVKYGQILSKNWRLLAIAFALITFIPIGDLYEHIEVFGPGTEDFWHHMHIFSSVIAFYFLYKFVMVIDAPKPEPFRNYAHLLIAVLAFAVAFSATEGYFEENFRNIYLLFYIFLGAAVFWAVYILMKIIAKVKIGGAAFSLKSFAIAMVPIISICLFLLSLGSVIAELTVDVFEGIASEPAMFMLIALLNVFYVMVAMTLTGFAYMGEMIYAFYSPITKFIQSHGGASKKGALVILRAARKKKK